MTRSTLLAAAALASGLAAAPLSAAPPLAVTVPSAMPLAAVGISEVACQPQATLPAQGFTPATMPGGVVLSARLAKSAAIMGGELSALERMRLSQSGVAAPAIAPPAAAAPPPAALSAANSRACSAIGARPAERLLAATAVPAMGRFLGTERVRIGRTRFDASWQRVSTRELSRRDLAATIGTPPQSRDELLGAVNRWVNREIRYRDDRVQFGNSDYWADARATLRTRRGDCEDYAILKMQLLAAAGVPHEDMMLTLARDTLRRSDHAVLLVRQDRDWVMLDMANDRIAPAASDYGYRPVMSFAAGQSFLHGTTVGAEPAPRPLRLARAD